MNNTSSEPTRGSSAVRPVRLLIAMYHSVDGRTGPADDPYGVTVAPDRLDRQLRALRDRGLRGVSVRELLAAARTGRARGLIGLTFDDGYADFLDTAVPLLRRHDCTATVFVLPGLPGGTNDWDPLGPRKPLLTEAGVRACAAAGMEVGSHGLRHRSLPAADDAVLRAETEESRALLREMTGAAPEGFCYPYGHLDARSVAAVRAAGYAYGCAIDPGALGGVHALPRVHVGQRDTGPRLAAKYLLHPLRRRPVVPAAAPVVRVP